MKTHLLRTFGSGSTRLVLAPATGTSIGPTRIPQVLPNFSFSSNDREEVEVTRRRTLDAAAGEYVVGFTIVDLDGNPNQSFSRVTIQYESWKAANQDREVRN